MLHTIAVVCGFALIGTLTVVLVVGYTITWALCYTGAITITDRDVQENEQEWEGE